jgi:hypothetical protein
MIFFLYIYNLLIIDIINVIYKNCDAQTAYKKVIKNKSFGKIPQAFLNKSDAQTAYK